jgi:hypothetical protein
LAPPDQFRRHTSVTNDANHIAGSTMGVQKPSVGLRACASK